MAFEYRLSRLPKNENSPGKWGYFIFSGEGGIPIEHLIPFLTFLETLKI